MYVLRSRALEYRESVAKACIERVCGGAPEPMRYLRRAVELIADTDSRVPVRFRCRRPQPASPLAPGGRADAWPGGWRRLPGPCWRAHARSHRWVPLLQPACLPLRARPALLQGLSAETVEYVLAHPSNAYDRWAAGAGAAL